MIMMVLGIGVPISVEDLPPAAANWAPAEEPAAQPAVDLGSFGLFRTRPAATIIIGAAALWYGHSGTASGDDQVHGRLETVAFGWANSRGWLEGGYDRRVRVIDGGVGGCGVVG